MGNDGGTIVKKIKESLEEKSEAGEDEEYTKLTTCAISLLPLYNQPIVSDYLGRLYLKEKVLEYIINKSSSNALEHITSMKDIVDTKINWKLVNSKYYIECPITHIIKTKNSEYGYLRECGCVVSYKLLQKLMSLKSDYNCPNCNKKFDKYDIVMINPMKNEEYTLINKTNFNHLDNLGLAHSKASKRKKKRNLADKQEKSKKVKKNHIV